MIDNAMKKILFITFLMFISQIAYGQTYIRLSDGFIQHDSTNILPRRSIKNTEKGILVSYEFDYAEIIPDVFCTNALIVKIGGFGSWGEVEKPALPLNLDRFSVPSNQCKIKIIDSTYIEIPMEIAPAIPPMENSDNTWPAKQSVKPIRPYRGLFPKCAISNTIHPYRNSYIADIYVMPVQYDYMNKRVRIFSKLSYLIDSMDGKKVQTTLNPYDGGDALLSNLILNPRDIDNKSRDVATEIVAPRYLILSVPQFSNAVNKFADWKRNGI